MPRISVLLTSFNHAKFLCEAIDSVLDQTFRDFELVIVDDASTDDSWWLINRYTDPRIRAVRSLAPGEVVWRMNEVITHSTSEFIAIHHSDDIWEPTKLEQQVRILDERRELGAVFTNARPMGEDGSEFGDPSHFYYKVFDVHNRSRLEWLRHFFDHGNALCHPSVLIRKSVFEDCGTYRTWLRQVDDLEMWIRVLLKHEIHVIPEKLVRFRVRDNEAQVSGNRSDTRMRNLYELYQALGNLRELQSFEDLCGIFPEARKLYRNEHTDLLFSLGLVMAEVAKRPFAQLLALHLLQETIADPARAASVRVNYGFGILEYFTWTGSLDIFSLEEIAKLGNAAGEWNLRLEKAEVSIASLLEQNANLNRGIGERDELILKIDQDLSEHKERVAHLTRGISTRDEMILSIDRSLSEQKALVNELNQEVAARDEIILSVNRNLSEQKARANELNQEIAARDEMIFSVNGKLSEHQVRIDDLKRQVASNEGLCQELSRLVQIVSEQSETASAMHLDAVNLRESLARMEQQLLLRNRNAEELQHTIGEIRGSSSWRITRPLRFFGRLMRSRVADVSTVQDLNHTIEPPATEINRQETAPLIVHVREAIAAPADVEPVAQPEEPAAAAIPPPEFSAIPEAPATSPPNQVDPDFDADFYVRLYPDLLGADIDPYDHYVRFGRAEGRIGSPPILPMEAGLAKPDPTRETILVVSHEASRSGAPVLSQNIAARLSERYNVVVLLLGPGPLVPEFARVSTQIAGPVQLRGSSALGDGIVKGLCAEIRFEFAIVNSIESRGVLRGLARASVPAVMLIHEFAAYTRPQDAFRFARQWASELVFSTRIIYDNAVSQHPELHNSTAHILPQGRCLTLPLDLDPAIEIQEKERIRQVLRPKGQATDQTLVVLGAGMVQYRKGVDIFLECAARVLREAPEVDCRFVWVGKGYDPEHDVGYSAYLAEQIHRSGLEDRFTFMPETALIEEVYANSDILLLSSRLDPLPNVAIDAMSCALPVICFAEATGIADALVEGGLAQECVAAHHDAAAITELLIELLRSPESRASVGRKSKEIAHQQFDMDRYVARIEEMALAARRKILREVESFDDILASGTFDRDFFLRERADHRSVEEIVRDDYLRSWATGIDLRKPFAGFHPGIYREFKQCGDALALDPLAHFLHAGQPDGPWKFEVIRDEDPILVRDEKLRVALHIHAYFADMLPPLLSALDGNESRPDLFISVSHEKAREEVREYLKAYQSRVEIQVVPNVGRDIGPMLVDFQQALRSYEIVGHLHTKRSGDIADASMGERWNRFLIENLLGSQSRMMDRILGRMAADPSIGMVFPQDPHVVGWGKNRFFAEALAKRLGIGELPECLEFPVGSMFWARTDALRALFELGLEAKDFPTEPLPYDGSILHAIERLFPFVVKQEGFRNVITHVRGVTR